MAMLQIKEEEPVDLGTTSCFFVDALEGEPCADESVGNSVCRSYSEKDNRNRIINGSNIKSIIYEELSKSRVPFIAIKPVPAKPLFICPTCGYDGKCPSVLQRHIFNVHELPKYFRCRRCDFKTESSQEYGEHKEIHKNEKIFECPYCEYKAAYKCRMERHMLTHSDERPYQCETCPYRTSRKSLLKFHVRAVHLKTNIYKCENCDFTTCYLNSLKKHVIIKHTVKTKCEYCEYSTNCTTRMADHVKAIHKKVKDISCPLCPFKCSRKKYIKIHINSRHLHIKPSKSVDLNEPKFKCYYCNKGITKKHSLQVHILRHMNIYLYKCKKCNYKTNVKATLKSHISVVHKKEKLYACTQCDYRAGRSDYLDKHVLGKHTNERPYVCPLCSKAFSRPDNMKCHIRKSHRHLMEID